MTPRILLSAVVTTLTAFFHLPSVQAALKARLTIGLFAWALVLTATWLGHVEQRALGMVGGALVCVIIVRGLSPLVGLGFAVGLVFYLGLLVIGYSNELRGGLNQAANTLADIALLVPHEPFTIWHVGAIAGLFICCFLFRGKGGIGEWVERYTWLDGAFFTDLAAFAQKLQRHSKTEGGICFGMLPDNTLLPAAWGPKNFFLGGGIGSGKTTYLKRLAASALRNVRPGSDQRALVYDQKGEMLPFLEGLSLAVPIRIICPLDQRCGWWDLASDIRDPKTAYQIAAHLIPTSSEPQGTRENAFFLQKARGIIAGLIISFSRHSRNAWTLADICLALRSEERYEAILRRDPDTASIINSLTHDEVRGDVLATLDNHRWKLELVAALWDQAMRDGRPSFTVSDWLSGSSVFLLTQDKSGGEIINPIFQALLACIIEGIASQSTSSTRRTWLFLDEFPTLGKVPNIAELVNTGRTRGAVTTVAIQDIEQMRLLYGPHETNAILGALKCKGVFQCSVETAKWIAEWFGKAEYFVERKQWSNSISHQDGKTGTSQTEATNTSRENVPLLKPEYFTYLPGANEENGFHAGFFMDGVAYAASEPFFEAINSLPKDTETPGYLAAPAEFQHLDDWKPSDFIRLKISLSATPPKSADESKAVEKDTINVKRNR